MEFLQTDLQTLSQKGISEETLIRQLEMLKDGFPYLKIEGPAVVGHGITRPSEDMEERSIRIWEEYLNAGGKVQKMVPASGAASRMFKNLFSFLEGKKERPSDDFMKEFFNSISKFAFFGQLNSMCMEKYGESVHSLIANGRYKDVVRALIQKEGLDYGQLPKALLQFHKTFGGSCSAIEEHLAEGAAYAAGKKGDVKIHFTVSEEHQPMAEAKIEEVKGFMEERTGKKFDISFSIQKPSTDTVASNLDGTPYREDGELFFRPGGHGALIENLNDLDADVIFIKNIDNVVPDSRRDATVRYKQVLAGYLVELHDAIGKYLADLATGDYTRGYLQEMLAFMHDKLSITDRSIDGLNDTALAMYIHEKLSRPLRVCGMVRNEGEPGGGPFIAFNPDGSASPQILESNQIDPTNEEYGRMVQGATHFNPVDLVCYIKDVHGNNFDLTKYVDPATGFISSKSSHGKELRAMELPGLWNGAMSDWNTAFVEVPIATFNPVKTVNDLLRPAHQS